MRFVCILCMQYMHALCSIRTQTSTCMDFKLDSTKRMRQINSVGTGWHMVRMFSFRFCAKHFLAVFSVAASHICSFDRQNLFVSRNLCRRKNFIFRHFRKVLVRDRARVGCGRTWNMLTLMWCRNFHYIRPDDITVKPEWEINFQIHVFSFNSFLWISDLLVLIQ